MRIQQLCRPAAAAQGIADGQCMGNMCRFQYIDFLHYSWTAQMINQFENTHIYVFLGIEVRAPKSCT